WTPDGSKFLPGGQGSGNIHVAAHVPLGRMFTVTDIDVEQELSRPYVYLARMHGSTHSAGFSIVSVKDLSRPRLLYTWRIEQPELHVGAGGLPNKYFKHRGRYY